MQLWSVLVFMHTSMVGINQEREIVDRYLLHIPRYPILILQHFTFLFVFLHSINQPMSLRTVRFGYGGPLLSWTKRTNLLNILEAGDNWESNIHLLQVYLKLKKRSLEIRWNTEYFKANPCLQWKLACSWKLRWAMNVTKSSSAIRISDKTDNDF